MELMGASNTDNSRAVDQAIGRLGGFMEVVNWGEKVSLLPAKVLARGRTFKTTWRVKNELPKKSVTTVGIEREI